MGDEKTITLRVGCDKSKMAQLKRKLDDGDINYAGRVSQSSFVASASKHNDIISHWIKSYGEGSDDGAKSIKSQLEGAKFSDEGCTASDCIFGVIEGASGMMGVLLHFSSKNRESKRTYNVMTVSMVFTSDTAGRDILGHPVELAILVLSGRSEDLKIKY